jgi:3-hydroxyisobutyrate dehydrogenase
MLDDKPPLMVQVRFDCFAIFVLYVVKACRYEAHKILIFPRCCSQMRYAPHLAGRTIIQMGTIRPEESVQIDAAIQAAGGDYFEAPVLGSIPQAQQAELIVMVGGSTEQFTQWRDLLAAFGPEPRHIGPLGKAAAVKLALNQLIGALTGAFSLSLGMVQRHGIDVETFMSILRSSALYAPTFDKSASNI